MDCHLHLVGVVENGVYFPWKNIFIESSKKPQHYIQPTLLKCSSCSACDKVEM